MFLILGSRLCHTNSLRCRMCRFQNSCIPTLQMMLRALSLLSCIVLASVAFASKSPHVGVIGAGYAGLTAALELRHLGYRVTVFERLDRVGGRSNHFNSSLDSSRTLQFDEGPSWYAMPDLIDDIFARYHAGGRASLYNTTRLDPSYRIRLPGGRLIDVPGTLEGLLALAGPSREPALRRFFSEAQYKYEQGVKDWLWRPMVSFEELISPNLFWAALSTDMFGGYEAHVRRHVIGSDFFSNSSEVLSDDDLITILKWPVIFLGASPRGAPSMYSMITYALHALGIWVPDGGMSTPVKALAQVASLNGVEFRLGSEVRQLVSDQSSVRQICTDANCVDVDGVVGAADYFHVEQHLLPSHLRRYDASFWYQATLSPSCLIYHLGFDQSNAVVKSLFESVLLHHTYFFDADLNIYLDSVFERQATLTDSTALNTSSFYVSAPFPPGLMVLVPVSYTVNGTDTAEVRQQILALVLRRMTAALSDADRALLNGGALQPLMSRSYGPADYTDDYNALRGNAFGLANTLMQSLLLRPSIDGKADNMAFAGHLTTPGPGVPPSMVSGVLAARVLHQKLRIKSTRFDVSDAVSTPFGVGVLIFVLTLLIGIAAVCSCLFEPSVSQFACLVRFYGHGSTFFAASTLMSLRAFWDTTALYALFRAADDCVDQVGVSADKRRALLDRFEDAFWRGLDGVDEGDASVDPILPCVVETCRRLQYPRRLFESFFESMRADCANANGSFVCHNMKDTCDYMEGSAAVIGEFMLPILLDGAAEQGDVREAARALGCAFQLTNMIRDVEEDRLLGRQYLPGALHSGHAKGIEEAIAAADQYYAHADRGIAVLPTHNGAQTVVRLARYMYSGIHDAIRAQQYDLHRRARVSNAAKLKMALDFLDTRSVVRLVLTHLFALLISSVMQYAPALVVLALAFAAPLYAPSQLTYAQFHYVFTLPAVGILWGTAFWRSNSDRLRRFFLWSLGMCLIATVYTTPWDNALVWNNVWAYPSERPLWGVLGWVPLEEYAFFTIETLIVAGTWWFAFPAKAIQGPPSRRYSSPVQNVGRLILGLLLVIGIELYPLYMGRILTWAVPILAIQWEFGSPALVSHFVPMFNTIALSSLSLCVLDTWAIADGIWMISGDHNLIHPVFTFGLPLEEAVFFILTSTMCAGGLTLAFVTDQLRVDRNLSWRDALFAVYQWGTAHTEPSPAFEPLSALHSVLIPCTVFVVMVWHQLFCSTFDEVTVLAVAVAFIGLPHGALDALTLKSNEYGPYVFGISITLLVWWLQPAWALLLFLLGSVLHFGEGDVQSHSSSLDWCEIVARGGLFLITVSRHPASCLRIFSILADASGAAWVLDIVLDYLVPLHLLAFIVTVCVCIARLHTQRAWFALTEMLSCALLFVFASPLTAFGVYFIAVHSVRHLLRVWLKSATSQQFAAADIAIAGVKYTWPVVAIAIAYVTYFSLPVNFISVSSLNSAFTESVLRAVFIGLSALTTPHAFLVWQKFT